MKTKVVLRLDLQNERDRSKALRKICKIPGVLSASADEQKLTVTGYINPVDLVKPLRSSFSNVRVESIEKVNDQEGTSNSFSNVREESIENMKDKHTSVSFSHIFNKVREEKMEIKKEEHTSVSFSNVPAESIETIVDERISPVKRATTFSPVSPISPERRMVKRATTFYPVSPISPERRIVNVIFSSFKEFFSTLSNSKKIGLTLSNSKKIGLTVDMHKQSENASDLPPTSWEVNKPAVYDWESSLYESVFYDRYDDRNRLLELLLSDDCRERDVSVVRIVGAGGVGKTTLVHVLLYNNSTICEVFDTRAWVCANERFDVKGLTKQVIESLAGISCSLTELTEIQEALAEELMDKRFLLVLDNICDDDVNFWSSLLIPLSVGAKGSIVLATTQNESEALTMDMMNSYELNRLPESNCWLVFHQHIFDGKNDNVHPELIEIGKQIITRCEGLPLIVNAIGGLLQSDLNEKFWQAVLESDLWCAGKNLPDLRYFYLHLTVHLQWCFQYCSLFPKGYVFEKDHLVRLWMSQGFVKHEEGKHDQDTGIEYFDELLKRSFFQHSPVCGPIEKKYVMHDLFHDLAQSVSVNKCFRAETCELPNIAEGVCHISLVPNGFDTTLKFETFKECRNINTFLLINRSNMTWDESSFYIENPAILNDLFFHLRYLKTLDLSLTNIQVIPESIANLQQLCYLALNKTNIRRLPESVCNLYNLQTLELRGCTYLSDLPARMKNLTNLQHLDVWKETGFVFMPRGVGQLTALQTLPAFMVGRDLQRHSGITELKHLINLRGSLCIGGLGNVTSGKEAKEAKLRMIKHLRSLVLHWCGVDLKSDRSAEIAYEVLQNLQPYSGLEELALRDYFGYQFPEWIADPSFPRLISLTLDNCCGCGILPQLGQLPSLKFLSIRKMDGVKHVDRQFIGSGTLRGFQSLETLKLWEMSELVEWFGVEDVDFPCLRSISISRCNKLRSLPSFTSLVELSIHCCALLPDLPALPCLKSLKIEGFQNLESLPQQLNLPALKVLEISNCYRLMSLGGLSHIASIEKLKVTRCPKLNC